MLVRALIVLFSVLNIGVAAWWIAHDPPPPSAPAQVPAGVARLELVKGDATPASAPAASIAAAAPAPPPAADLTAPPEQQCFTFGPFATSEAVAAASARLEPLVQKLTTREQPALATGSARGWRVYLPPLPSPEQAQVVAQRIGAAGFDDFLVVREGAEANSIALGRYRTQDSAKKRADALIAAGFAVQTEPLGQADEAAKTFWLDVVADEAFDPRQAQTSIAAAQYRKADCAVR